MDSTESGQGMAECTAAALVESIPLVVIRRTALARCQTSRVVHTVVTALRLAVALPPISWAVLSVLAPLPTLPAMTAATSALLRLPATRLHRARSMITSTLLLLAAVIVALTRLAAIATTRVRKRLGTEVAKKEAT